MSVLVKLYYGELIYNLIAKETSTIKDLLTKAEIQEDVVVFTGSSEEVNKTPIIDLSKTLRDYNMWFLEKSYVADLTVYNKTDNYNKELYELYLEVAKEII